MGGARLETLEVGEDRRRIAAFVRDGAAPGLVFLGGFRSDMEGTKAVALDAFAAETGRACLRLDYSGHGRSGGRFEDGTITRWLEEARAAFDAFTRGPQVVVGSSMGGWIALLLAPALREAGEEGRLAGLVLIAPAWDMTRRLMADRFTQVERREMDETGRVLQPSAYSDEPYVLTRALIEDGERHLFGNRLIEVGCPVHVLQGMRDEDVPFGHALDLMERLAHDEAVLTLVKDGDHRLSRPQDIDLLRRAIEAALAAR